MIMQFRAKRGPVVSHAERFKYDVDPRTGQRSRRRVRAFHDDRGRPTGHQSLYISEYWHDGRLVKEGDVIESTSDLALAFPNRFERVEESV